MRFLNRLRWAAPGGDNPDLNGHLELARRPKAQSHRHTIEDEVPAPEGLVVRFLAWADPPGGTVGTGGMAARAVLFVLLCLVGTLALVGVLAGAALGIASIL